MEELYLLLGGIGGTVISSLNKSLGAEFEKIFSRLFNGSLPEALEYYRESITQSQLPIIEKTLLIDEAPRRICKLRNKKAICDKAFEKLVNPGKIPDSLQTLDLDMIYLILEEAEKVSNDDIQEMWASILKETIEQRSVSKRLIGILGKLNSYEAQIFGILSNYLVWFSSERNGRKIPIGTGFFNGTGYHYGYKIDSLKRGDVSRLVQAGLLQIQADNYEYQVKNEMMQIQYFNKKFDFKPSNGWLKCSHFRLTFEGEELVNCLSKDAEDADLDYFEFIKSDLYKQGIIFNYHENV